MEILPRPPEHIDNLDARLASKVSEIRDRLDMLDRNRPQTAIGITPPDDSIAASGHVRYMDAQARRFYVYANGQWISADSARYTATATNTVSVGPSGGTDSGWVNIGPSITFYVSAPGIIHIYVETYVMGTASGASVLTGGYYGYQVDGGAGGQAMVGKSASYNVWERRVGAAANGATNPTGADWPRGGFIVLAVAPGTHTLDMLGRAVEETPGGGHAAQAVQYDDRRLGILIL